MKRVLVFFLMLSALHTWGQDGVIVAAAVAVGHGAEVAMLDRVREEEEKIFTQQLAITATTGGLLAIETRIYDGLTTVQSIITNATVVLQIENEVDQIARLSGDIKDMLVEDPILSPIILREVNLLIEDHGFELAKMAIATTGGEVNLMNNKERLEIMEDLLKELGEIKQQLYGIKNILEVSTWVDIFEAGDQFLIDSGVDYDEIFRESIETLNELKILQDFAEE